MNAAGPVWALPCPVATLRRHQILREKGNSSPSRCSDPSLSFPVDTINDGDIGHRLVSLLLQKVSWIFRTKFHDALARPVLAMMIEMASFCRLTICGAYNLIKLDAGIEGKTTKLGVPTLMILAIVRFSRRRRSTAFRRPSVPDPPRASPEEPIIALVLNQLKLMCTCQTTTYVRTQIHLRRVELPPFTPQLLHDLAWRPLMRYDGQPLSIHCFCFVFWWHCLIMMEDFMKPPCDAMTHSVLSAQCTRKSGPIFTITVRTYSEKSGRVGAAGPILAFNVRWWYISSWYPSVTQSTLSHGPPICHLMCCE